MAGWRILGWVLVASGAVAWLLDAYLVNAAADLVDHERRAWRLRRALGFALFGTALLINW